MAALVDPNSASLHIQALEDAARARGVGTFNLSGGGPEEILAAIDTAKASGAETVNVLSSAYFWGNRQIIMQRVAALRLPRRITCRSSRRKAVLSPMALVRSKFFATSWPRSLSSSCAALSPPTSRSSNQPSSSWSSTSRLRQGARTGCASATTRPRRRGDRMRRREFISLSRRRRGRLGRLPVRAQQAAMPMIGFLSSRSPGESAGVVAAFRQGLGEAEFVEGQNLVIAFRWAKSALRPVAGFGGRTRSLACGRAVFAGPRLPRHSLPRLRLRPFPSCSLR